jgi:hypothetical protein
MEPKVVGPDVICGGNIYSMPVIMLQYSTSNYLAY